MDRESVYPSESSRRATRGLTASGQRLGARGQSLVEFALVTPILVVLIVATADFGRVFATGVMLEAAARNAAEVAANEYLANPPGPLDSSAPTPASTAYYDGIHLLAARTVCQELRELPNTSWAAGDCPTSPAIQVCVHDSVDPQCSTPPGAPTATPPVAYAAMPAACDNFPTPPMNGQLGSTERWVEVRICYRFTTIIQLAPMPTEIWLQRQRIFTIPCYFALGTADPCGV